MVLPQLPGQAAAAEPEIQHVMCAVVDLLQLRAEVGRHGEAGISQNADGNVDRLLVCTECDDRLCHRESRPLQADHL